LAAVVDRRYSDEEIREDFDGNTSVRGFDGFGGVMADAAFATHKQHGDGANFCEHYRIVAGAAGKLKNREAAIGDALGKNVRQHFVAWHGVVFLDWLPKQLETAAPGEGARF